ncbi:hypothetical protein J3A83DRAFT_4359987 [Scleroderma citrinum]
MAEDFLAACIFNFLDGLKGQSLNLHIPQNIKSGRGFNYECTGALLCPTGLDWNNHKIQTKLMNSQIQVAGDQWPIFLYANYTYYSEDPWNGLHTSEWPPCFGESCDPIIVLLLFNHPNQAFKHIFTSPSSVDQELKVTCSSNAHLHGMQIVTKASIAYVAIQYVFSHSNLITDSECFYTSIIHLLDDPDKKDEVNQLLMWWNRYKLYPWS